LNFLVKKNRQTKNLDTLIDTSVAEATLWLRV
jgi:hypothetical protein